MARQVPSHRRRSRRGDSAAAATEETPQVVVRRSNGAELEVELSGGAVVQSELMGLAHRAAETQARRARALSRLTQHLVELENDVNARRRKSGAALLRRVKHGDDRLGEKLQQTAKDLAVALAAARDGAETTARGRDERNLWHNATILSAIPLFTFYGRRDWGNNLTLAVLALVFVLGDRVTDFFSGKQEPNERSRWWLYLSPLANWLAAWWLLGNGQRERFVAGVASDFELVGTEWKERKATECLPGLPRLLSALGVRRRRPRRGRIERYEATVDLSGAVAPDFVQELALCKDPPTLASLVSVEHDLADGAFVEPVFAEVRDGRLLLRVHVHSPLRAAGAKRQAVRGLKVAWLVDLLRHS